MKYVLYFNEIDKKKINLVGGKGVNLGELFNNGFSVPEGFCVTTEAYDLLMQDNELKKLVKKLNDLNYKNIESIRETGEQIRNKITETEVSEAIKITIYGAWNNLGANYSYAVRSSATAEDLQEASFAGQQDTYLNIRGYENLVEAVKKCWASLFTDRAIVYRNKNGFDNTAVKLSVVVQRMIGSEYSGIIFTADPVTGNRKMLNIDAGYGLGEAIVSGLVTPDFYQVYNSEIVNKQIARKETGIFPDNEGGVFEVEIIDSYKEKQVLTDKQILELADTGIKIQTSFGNPQDIEWGYYQDKFYILQSRPITSLYPIPRIEGTDEHVFISFGHIQMMTDAMKPLALSIFEITRVFDKFGASNSTSVQYNAGGRIFLDLSYFLNIPKIRDNITKVIKYSDEQISLSIQELLNRGCIFANNEEFKKKIDKLLGPLFLKTGFNLHMGNINRLKAKGEKFFKNESGKWEKDINSYKGIDKIKRIRWYTSGMLNFLFSNALQYPATAILALSKIKKICLETFDENKTEELLSKLNMSLENNITSNMMMEIYDMADSIRGSREMMECLKKTTDENFWKDLEDLKKNIEFTLDMKKFMDKYGMRCSGEIDITLKRWEEAPTEVIPFILNHIQTSKTNEHREKFKQGLLLAKEAENEIIQEVRSKQGRSKARKTARFIKVYRNLMGFRESPKYFIIKFFGIVRNAVLSEADILTTAGIFEKKEDIYYFSLDEVIQILEGTYNKNIEEVINIRKNKFESYKKMNPPRVMTSSGEILTGNVENNKAPEGSFLGTAASAGITEGIANVVLKVNEADLKEGEILVAPFTDPAWTPLFNSAKAVITEVGGMMTHGSVIAREYGIPAVVGVNEITKLIKSGDKIRVNGSEGYVEIIERAE